MSETTAGDHLLQRLPRCRQPVGMSMVERVPLCSPTSYPLLSSLDRLRNDLHINVPDLADEAVYDAAAEESLQPAALRVALT
jgi:hypothetical protein